MTQATKAVPGRSADGVVAVPEHLGDPLAYAGPAAVVLLSALELRALRRRGGRGVRGATAG
ncbi:hypothetical protein [Kitasatospora sp. NPDC005751]|uniref:hypothetical protein n=1 Tax=Kitasatospora sp. NPDC005751 TaxID=3157064 RepID=UPI0033F06239